MADSFSTVWGDGDHRFALPLAQAIELEDLCNAGLLEVFTRVTGGTWRTRDLRETVRLGLIGGGLSPSDAHKLMVRYVDQRPWLENIEITKAILAVALSGYASGDDGEGKREAAEAETEVPIASPPPPSTGPAL